MMKSAFVFVCVIFAINAARFNEQKVEYTDAEVQGIIDDVKELFEKLKAAVSKALDEAKEFLDKLTQKVEDEANKAIEKAKAEVSKEIDELLVKFDAMIAEVTDKDVTPCVDQYRPQLQVLGNVTIDNIVGCVTGKIQEGKDIVNDAWTRCQDIYNELKNIEDDIDDCGHNVICLTKLVAKLTKDIVEFPLQITKDYLEAEALITDLLPSLGLCAAEKLAEMGVDGANILKDTADCIKNI